MPASVPEAAVCVPSVPYSPSGVTVPGTGALGWTTRFRLSTTSAADSSNVYVAMCDAGSVAIISPATSTISVNGTNDTLIMDLAAPFGAGFPLGNGEPPPQNPIFMLSGQ